MKILIAEDELLSASHLKIIVMEMGYAEPQIVDNTEKLLQSIAIEAPNLVLIDVRLKGIKDGIVAAEIIAASENPIPVIFITAMKDATTFERAKKTQPHSYITKPFQVEELQRAIELALYNHLHWDKNSVKNLATGKLLQDSFFVIANKDLVKVQVKEIVYMEVVEKFTKIICLEENHMVRMPMSHIMLKLPQTDFVQVHRNFIINANFLDKINNEGTEVFIKDNKIPLSKRYKELLMKRINTL